MRLGNRYRRGTASHSSATGLKSSRNGGAGYLHTFTYDFAGNPLSFQAVNQTFTADNQINVSNYHYDGNGNPILYKGNMLGFDTENRLTTYSSVLTNTFTAEGLRAKKQSSNGTFYYLYDGAEPAIVPEETEEEGREERNLFYIMQRREGRGK